LPSAFGIHSSALGNLETDTDKCRTLAMDVNHFVAFNSLSVARADSLEASIRTTPDMRRTF
jgi:hypothetical protein